MARIIPISVVETPEFLAVTRKMMTEDQRKDLVDFLAYHPTSGDLIQGSGGVRKLRWGLEGRGKRGGARVIYFYHHPGMPVFMLTAFAKNDRSDLSRSDIEALKELTVLLVKAYENRPRS
jgi:hypothetical protein